MEYERGSVSTQAILATLIVAAILVLAGYYISSTHATQMQSYEVETSGPNVGSELDAVLRNDSTFAHQSSLQSGASATFPVAGGVTATVSIQGSQAVVVTPTGYATIPLVSQAGGN